MATPILWLEDEQTGNLFPLVAGFPSALYVEKGEGWYLVLRDNGDGSMTTDQIRPRASRAQRRVKYLFSGPAKNPPTVNVTKNSEPTRPIWEELMPSSRARGWAIMPRTALSA